MTPSERFQKHYSKPLPDGTGLKPAREWVEYRGIALTADVAKRIAEYRALPSLTEADIARMLT